MRKTATVSHVLLLKGAFQMNTNMENTIYGKLPVVAGLNKVQGFDPRKFMRRVVSEQTKQESFYLDLKFKKLWFRLACPKGRIKTTALKITEQLAIIEAKVYFDRNDKEPAASFIAQRNAKDTPGALYIETAQYAAVDQALVDAGFGLQFADVGLAADAKPYDAGIPATGTGAVLKITETVPVPQTDASVKEAPTQAAVQAEPVREVAVVQESQAMADNPPASFAEEAAIQEENLTASAETVQEMPAAPPTIQEGMAEQADIPTVHTDTAETPTEELVDSTAGAAYSAAMPVDEICRLMTVEDAENYIVDTGTCKGWTLAQVAQKRAASLKFYLNGYRGDNNILRAGAKLLLEQMAG